VTVRFYLAGPPIPALRDKGADGPGTSSVTNRARSRTDLDLNHKDHVRRVHNPIANRVAGNRSQPRVTDAVAEVKTDTPVVVRTMSEEMKTESMSTNIPADADLFGTLNGIPKIDIPANLQAALSAGRRMTSILREVVSLRLGAGKLTPNEYFYYRLWDPVLTAEEKRRFVGKQAQHPMHLTCNDPGWYAVAADKLLFQALMAGARLPVPPLLAVAQEDGEPEKRTYSRVLTRPPVSCETRRFTPSLPNPSPGNTASPSRAPSARFLRQMKSCCSAANARPSRT
jgi:hypothetical protein